MPLREQPDFRDTDESKTFAGKVHHRRRNIPLANNAVSAEERLPGGTDELSILNATRERLGIRPDETPVWMLDVEGTAWKGLVATDTVEQKIDAINERLARYGLPGEARVIMKPGTDRPIRRRDCILVVYPTSLKEATDREEEARTKRYLEQINGRQLEGDTEQMTLEDKIALRDANSKAIHDALQNSPSQGIPLETMLAVKSPEEMAREAIRHRAGTRIGQYTREEIEEEVKMRVNAAKSGRKTFGGLSGKPSSEGGKDNWQRTADRERAAAATRR